MVITARKTNSINVKDNPKNMILIGSKNKQNLYWKNFTFLTSLFRFILFTLCGKYSETFCVADSIIATWTRSYPQHKPFRNQNVSGNCEYGRMQILVELRNTKSVFLVGGHLVTVKELTHQEVPIRVHQRGELN